MNVDQLLATAVELHHGREHVRIGGDLLEERIGDDRGHRKEQRRATPLRLRHMGIERDVIVSG